MFGAHGAFAFQVKVPVTTLYLQDGATQSGLGDVVTAFAWNFHRGSMLGLGARQYVSLALQLRTAPQGALAAPWAVVPGYAVAVALAHWVSLPGGSRSPIANLSMGLAT